jgi:hypothetical protein
MSVYVLVLCYSGTYSALSALIGSSKRATLASCACITYMQCSCRTSVERVAQYTAVETAMITTAIASYSKAAHSLLDIAVQSVVYTYCIL